FIAATTTATHARPYAIPVADLRSPDLTNYDFTASTVDAALTINQAHLTVVADSQSKTYDGQVFMPFTAHYTGFITGQSADNVAITGSPAFSGAAITAVNAGRPYAIHVA